MSEKNNNIFENDLMMRAILEGGQEEVPGRVWERVSERLGAVDTKTARKPVTLWWKRAGFAIAAAAAAVVAIILTEGDPKQIEMVPRAVQGDMIAVVEQETAATEPLLAYIPETSITKIDVHEQIVSDNEVTSSETIIEEAPIAENEIKTDETPTVNKDETKEAVQDTWQTFDEWVEDDETPSRKVKTSVTVSGLTGATQQQTNTSVRIVKAPSRVLAPTKTGIKEKETKYGIPVSVGAGVRFEFTPRWSLGVGLNYTLLTRTLQGTYTHVTETGSIDNLITSDMKNSQHYIGLPVNAFFSIINNKEVNFYTYAGGSIEKCIADRYHVLSSHVIHKEKAVGVQLSAAIGLGGEFNLTEHLGLYIDPSLRYYFDCDQPKSIRTAQPLMFSVEAGLRFRL